jgi:hypothetical protein
LTGSSEGELIAAADSSTLVAVLAIRGVNTAGGIMRRTS